MARKPKIQSDNVDPTDLDPIIEGLLLRMPQPGTFWPTQERQQWVSLLQGALNVLYKDKPDPDQA